MDCGEGLRKECLWVTNLQPVDSVDDRQSFVLGHVNLNKDR